jgi:hypothetical protein
MPKMPMLHSVTVVNRKQVKVLKLNLAWPGWSIKDRIAYTREMIGKFRKLAADVSDTDIDSLFEAIDKMVANIDRPGTHKASDLRSECMLNEVELYQKNNGGSQEAAIRTLMPLWEMRWGKRADFRQEVFRAKRARKGV